MTHFAKKNNVESLVYDNPLTADATTLNVPTGEGALFGTVFPFELTIYNAGMYPNPKDDPDMEIVKCTARINDALTIVRAQEGTSAKEHIKNSKVIMAITALLLNEMVTQDGAQIYGEAIGSTDSYAVTLYPVLTAISIGMIVRFKANTANTGACSLNVNGLGTITIKKNKDQDLADGDIKSGQMVEVQYDGTYFQMLSQIGNVSFNGKYNFIAGETINGGDAPIPVAIGTDSIVPPETALITADCSTSYNYPWLCGTTFIGQNFVAVSNYLTAIAINFYINSTTGKNININIYAADANGKPTGSSLGNVSILDTAVTNGGKISFSSPIQLTIGAVYVIVVSYPTGGSGYIGWRNSNGSNIYANGTGLASSDSGSTWALASTDYGFAIYGYAYCENGKVYKCGVANPRLISSFIGFAVSNANTGDNVTIQKDGILTGLSLPALSATVAETVDVNISNNVSYINASNGPYGQTFITGDNVGNLSAISLYMYKSQSGAGSIQLDVYEVSGDGQSGSGGRPTGGSLGSITITNAEVTSGTWLKKSFASPIPIKPRHKYCLIMKESVSNSYLGAYYNSNSTTSTPEWITGAIPGSGSVYLNYQSMTFKTHYTQTVNAYTGDNVYLQDVPGLGYNEGTYRLRVGKLIDNTKILLDSSQEDETIIATLGMYFGSHLTSGTLYFPVPRNTRKIKIMGQYESGDAIATVDWEKDLNENPNIIMPYGNGYGFSSIAKSGNMLSINFSSNNSYIHYNSAYWYKLICIK